MSPFDWVLIAIAVFFGLKGIIKGAVREVFSLAAMLFASFAAFCYYQRVLYYIQPYIERYIASKWGQLSLACLAIFLAVWIAVNLVGFLIEKFLKLIWLGFLDHAAGLAVGAAKAYLIACVLVIGLLVVPLGHEVLKGSRLTIYTMPTIAKVRRYFPEGLRKMINDGWVASRTALAAERSAK